MRNENPKLIELNAYPRVLRFSKLILIRQPGIKHPMLITKYTIVKQTQTMKFLECKKEKDDDLKLYLREALISAGIFG